jgi:hypothetical protein
MTAGTDCRSRTADQAVVVALPTAAPHSVLGELRQQRAPHRGAELGPGWLPGNATR